MVSRLPVATALVASLALSACGGASILGTHEAGSAMDEGGFGNPTMNNILVMSGERQFLIDLSERFVREVPTTINFAFNSASLDQQARAILRQQAAWIRQFPEVRFSVYGHTDLVGGNAYNQRLGQRRAQTAVNFLVSEGVERSRLEALVSLGETQPIVATEAQERRNRRTVTEVAGFLQDDPLVMDGRYGDIVYRQYGGPRTGGGN